MERIFKIEWNLAGSSIATGHLTVDLLEDMLKEKGIANPKVTELLPPKEYCECNLKPGDIVYYGTYEDMVKGICPKCHKPLKPRKKIEKLPVDFFENMDNLIDKVNEIIDRIEGEDK